MTAPTADAAKLLPCPTCKSEKPEWRRAYVADGKVQTCPDTYHNMRPQPAPPAGEPDFEKFVQEFLAEYRVTTGPIAPDALALMEIYFTRMYRLGLAGRPTVEDAEIRQRIEELRAIGFYKTADLLQRLAGELIEVKRDRDNWHRFYHGYRKDFEALYRRLGVPDTNDEQAGINLCDRITALLASESKLAEREAELAKADAELDWIARHDHQDMEFGPTMNEARNRHAARQQQKASAEKDKP